MAAATLACNAKSHCRIPFAGGAQLDVDGRGTCSGAGAIAAHISARAAVHESSGDRAAGKSRARTNKSRFRDFSRRADSLAIEKSKHRGRRRVSGERRSGIIPKGLRLR